MYGLLHIVQNAQVSDPDIHRGRRHGRIIAALQLDTSPLLLLLLFFMDVDITILILVTKQTRSHEYETIEHMVGATKEFLGPEE